MRTLNKSGERKCRHSWTLYQSELGVFLLMVVVLYINSAIAWNLLSGVGFSDGPSCI